MSGAAQDELRLIADSARDFATGHAGPARARQRLSEAAGTLDAAGWRGIAELGWFGIAVPEAAGGLDLGPAAACSVAEEAGRALLMPPLTMAMAAARLLSASADEAAAAALKDLLAGRKHIAMAATSQAERQSIREGAVPDGDLAAAFVVASGTGDGFEARLVPRDAPGVARLNDQCVDGSWLAQLRIETSAWSDAPRLVQGAAGQAAWHESIDLLRLSDAAYLCGTMAVTLEMSLDYLRLRHQFGVPIGSFQALQHRAADCHIQVAATRALVCEAARAFGQARGRFAAAASIRRATVAALQVTKENVQFHGAIGFAEEHDAGLYLRRAMVLAARHGGDVMKTLQGCGAPA